MITPDLTRPNVAMSHEEASALSKLTAAVEVVASGHRRLEDTVDKFINATDRRFDSLSERGRFSRGDLFSVLGAATAIAGVITAMLSMRIDNALAPIQTRSEISIADRAILHAEVDKIFARIDAGKDARLAAEREAAVRLAVLEDHDKRLRLTAPPLP